MNPLRAALAAATLLAATTACQGAGLYGHAPRYAPLGDEADAVAGAREYDPVMAERQPEEWRKGSVMLFGVVLDRAAGPGGQALLKLGVRRLEPRNLCESEHDDDSCRVTVSDKDFGVLYALVQLRGEDDVGPHAVGIRSLVRVVGRLGQETSPSGGAPILHATWARHWPVFTYVTRASARDLRQ